MSLSPAQRHNQRIAMEQRLKQSLAVGTTESMHLLIKALETDVEQLRSLPLIADRVEHKRNVLLPKWVPIVDAYLASGQVYANPVLAWAEESAGRGESIEPYFSRTFENVTTQWRLHEQVTAKWFKFAGLELLRGDDGQKTAASVDDIDTLKKADELLATAEKYYSKIGVKTKRQTIAARMRKLTQG